MAIAATALYIPLYRLSVVRPWISRLLKSWMRDQVTCSFYAAVLGSFFPTSSLLFVFIQLSALTLSEGLLYHVLIPPRNVALSQ